MSLQLVCDHCKVQAEYLYVLSHATLHDGRRYDDAYSEAETHLHWGVHRALVDRSGGAQELRRGASVLMSHYTAQQRYRRAKRDPFRAAQIAPSHPMPSVRCADCLHLRLRHEATGCLDCDSCTEYREATNG